MNFHARFWLGIAAAVLALAAIARADDFADHVDLSPLHTVAVQHNETMKTLDTFSRQVIYAITGRSTLDGRDPVFTLLDMSFHPENYVQRNIIKIANIPLRKDFELLDSIDTAEKTRIEHEGTVSLVFLEQPDVLNLLQKDQAESVIKTNAINQVFSAMQTLHEICEGDDRGLIPAAIIAPGPGSTDPLWHRPSEMLALLPGAVEHFKQLGQELPAAPAGYDAQQDLLSKIFASCGGLLRGWDAKDVDVTNHSAQELADLLPQVNPAVYPSHAKRVVEVAYNRLMKLTIPGAAFYLIAFILFVLSANADVRGFRLWGLRFMIIAFVIHTTGIAIRWWLVGSVFPPIKNEFESVMCSAWFGAFVALVLELRKSRGLFGAAGSFVGCLALVAIFAAPYVTDKQIGGEIAPVQGILMSYWLYIHVTMVTGSYSLIGMGFLLSSWWLIRYYRQKPQGKVLVGVPGGSGRFSREPENLLPVGGGAMALGFARTLAMTFFIPQPRIEPAVSESALRIDSPDQAFLQTLDKCNLVVLQLAFWMLGAGIMLGAIWADQSWGRPWGWDPKETFALITWIVYLIAVHVRVAVVNKAWWTAVLGCAGFFVMLFNWIGVNFFLVGLHSYA
jgi:cytochrome c-type biogenesis protein CcsB